MTKLGIGKASTVPALPLLDDIRGLIESARQRAATAVNIELTLLYWRIGRRIQTDVLVEKRADYGLEIVATLSRQLVQHYGRGFAEKSLRRMIQFAAAFPEEPIVATLSQQLSWSHIVEVLPLRDALQQDFYVQMCATEPGAYARCANESMPCFMSAPPSRASRRPRLHKNWQLCAKPSA